MGEISAQISIYPLRRRAIGGVIDVALRSLGAHSVEVAPGPMSTVIIGNEDQVFGALRAAFDAACEGGDAVLVATVSNACPMRRPARHRGRTRESAATSGEARHDKDRHHHL